MKEFTYVIKADEGLHARPAGILLKKCAAYKSKITIFKGEKSAEATRLMKVMSLGAKKGDEVLVRVEGEDEDSVFEEVKAFFEAEF